MVLPCPCGKIPAANHLDLKCRFDAFALPPIRFPIHTIIEQPSFADR